MIKIRTLLRKAPITGVTALYSVLFGVLYRSVPDRILKRLYQKIPQEIAMALLGLLTLTTIILVTLVIILRSKLKKRLKPRFNLLWDDDLQPYCSDCGNHLKHLADPIKNNPLLPSIPSALLQKSSFKCLCCNKQFQLVDDDARVINLSEAREKMKI